MPSLFPTTSALSATFGQCSPFIRTPVEQRRSPNQARTELYQSWNVTEDAKQKTQQLSNAAMHELEKASEKVQAKTGAVELYSAKYYVCFNFELSSSIPVD